MMYKVPRLDEISEEEYLRNSASLDEAVDGSDSLAADQYCALLAIFGEQEEYDDNERRDTGDGFLKRWMTCLLFSMAVSHRFQRLHRYTESLIQRRSKLDIDARIETRSCDKLRFVDDKPKIIIQRFKCTNSPCNRRIASIGISGQPAFYCESLHRAINAAILTCQRIQMKTHRLN